MRPRTGTSGLSRSASDRTGSGAGARSPAVLRPEVRDKLKALHAELDRGLRTSAAYTVQQAVDDWLRGRLPAGPRTPSVYREALTPLMGQIGAGRCGS